MLGWALLVRSQEVEQYHIRPESGKTGAGWTTHIGIKEDVKKLKYLWDRVQSQPAEVACQWTASDLVGWALEIGVDRERFIRTFVRIGADVFDASVVEWMSDQGTIEEGEDTAPAADHGTRLP